MNIELGSPALEIAIALSLVFFVLSLIVTAVTEFLSGLRNLRAKTLKEGLEGMIGDKGIVTALYQHPLLRSDLGKRHRDPSYVSAKNFAKAFQDVVGDASRLSCDLDRQLKAIAPNGALLRRKQLEAWFDDGMDRVNGWYKRKAQLISVLVAVAVTLALNVSTLHLVGALESDPTVRAAVVSKAEAVAASEEVTGTTVEEGAAEIKQAGEKADKALDDLDQLKTPLFWGAQNLPAHWTATEIGLWVFGWLLTILAISLGAPFWFDTLGKLSNLRLAGKKPETEKPQTT